MTDTPPPTDLVEQLAQMNELFAEIAAGAGASPLLLLAGTLLIVFSIAVAGFLTAGAALDVVTRN